MCVCPMDFGFQTFVCSIPLLTPSDLSFEIFIYLCLARCQCQCQCRIEIRIIRIALIHSFVRSFHFTRFDFICFRRTKRNESNQKSKPQKLIKFSKQVRSKSFQVALKVAGMRPYMTLIIYVMWGEREKTSERTKNNKNKINIPNIWQLATHAHTAGGNQKKVGVYACTLHFNCFTFQSLYPFRPRKKVGLNSGCVCLRVSFQTEKSIFQKMISMEVQLRQMLGVIYENAVCGCVNWRCCKSTEEPTIAERGILHQLSWTCSQFQIEQHVHPCFPLISFE